jgi:Zn-dependent M16 (insulinase) family peptidase
LSTSLPGINAKPSSLSEIDPQVIPSKWTQHWELETKINLSGVLPVYKYKSKRTGLTVALAQADSPIVNGYFCLATEAWNGDGLPHTLEHLIFLGSEDYPYKEVLDLMANRCLADRTNAWTDTDHTCYTVYTAGSNGFLNILPVYLDHIFHPLLREEDFMTEVHHINGDGDDAGVVYSEMQGVEHKPSNIIYFDLIKQIYPGNSSYTVQTGGKLKSLRESTTIEKVRAYHKKYYRPENTYLTITGGIDPAMIFAALDPVERKLMEKMEDYPDWEKPFSVR